MAMNNGVQSETTRIAKWIENWKSISSVLLFVVLIAFYAAVAYSNTVSKPELEAHRLLMVTQIVDLEKELKKELAINAKDDNAQKMAVQEIKVDIAIVQTQLETIIQMLRNR